MSTSNNQGFLQSLIINTIIHEYLPFTTAQQ